MNSKENFVQAMRELTGFNEGTVKKEMLLSHNMDVSEKNGYEKPSKETHITIGMVVKGTIQSQSGMIVEGSVQGDIKAENIILTGAKVKGDLHISSKAEVCRNTEIIGNILAENIVVSGRVKGDIQAGDTTELKSGSYIEGNINTGDIISDPGAGIRGAVVTGNSSIYDDEVFDLGGDIR